MNEVKTKIGEVSEWFKELVLKTSVLFVPWVRIPLFPYIYAQRHKKVQYIFKTIKTFYFRYLLYFTVRIDVNTLLRVDITKKYQNLLTVLAHKILNYYEFSKTSFSFG